MSEHPSLRMMRRAAIAIAEREQRRARAEACIHIVVLLGLAALAWWLS